MELITILKHESFSLPGSIHLQGGTGCEDRIWTVHRNNCTAAVLCDGAGSFHSGAAAAAHTARTLSELLAEEFETLYRTPSEEVRLTVIRAVERSLTDYSRHHGIPPAELACTILAAAVTEDGRCICLHLGDGIILQQNEGDPGPSVVSCPMTGLAPHTTYLTMNCDLHRYLRFYRWREHRLARILLFSDGAAEHLVRLCGGAGWVYTAGAQDLPAIRSRLIQCSPADDYSSVLISRSVP